MRRTLSIFVNVLVSLAVLVVLVLVIWQPVLPSGWIIQGMASQINPASLSIDRPVVLRFELAGEGGGVYNLRLSSDKVDITEGATDQVDLLIATSAKDFNQIVFQLAQGKVDESAFAKLVISNVLKIAGDMTVLEALNPASEGTQ